HGRDQAVQCEAQPVLATALRLKTEAAESFKFPSQSRMILETVVRPVYAYFHTLMLQAAHLVHNVRLVDGVVAISAVFTTGQKEVSGVRLALPLAPYQHSDLIQRILPANRHEGSLPELAGRKTRRLAPDQRNRSVPRE